MILKLLKASLIISINAFRDDRKLIHKKVADINGKLDIIS